jgi:hypothetical protein
MSLHVHSIDAEELISLPKPHGKKAKADQQVSAQQEAVCNCIMKRKGDDSELVFRGRERRSLTPTQAAVIDGGQ